MSVPGQKSALGFFLGAAVYFIAGVFAWTVFPWHNKVMKKLPEETYIRDVIKVAVEEPGFYFFPSDRTDNGRMDPRQYKDHFKAGPAGFLMVTPGGTDYILPQKFVVGFINAMVAAAFCLGILILGRGVLVSYRRRVLAVLGVGVFVWFNSHVPYWNWFFFPANYMGAIFLDTLLAYGLMGLVLARFVPEPQP